MIQSCASWGTRKTNKIREIPPVGYGWYGRRPCSFFGRLGQSGILSATDLLAFPMGSGSFVRSILAL